MWQCFCCYGIFSVGWKSPEALRDSSPPHPHLLHVQSLCCSMRSSPKTLLGPAAIQKESNAKLNQKAKRKRTSILSLKTATVSSEQLTTSALFIRKYTKLSCSKWCTAHAWPVIWRSFILPLAASWSWEGAMAWSSYRFQPSLAALFFLQRSLIRGRNVGPWCKRRWRKII